MRLVPFGREHFQALAGWFGSERDVVQWGGTTVRYPLDDAQMSEMRRLGELAPPERLCWMAAEGGDLVGHAQLAYDWRNGSARIGRVAIAPAFRGRGLAKPLKRLPRAADCRVRLGLDQSGERQQTAKLPERGDGGGLSRSLQRPGRVRTLEIDPGQAEQGKDLGPGDLSLAPQGEGTPVVSLGRVAVTPQESEIALGPREL